MFDPYNGLKLQTAIAPQTVGTTGTGRTGKIIDRQGYIGPVLFEASYGAITSSTAVFTATVKEGDVTGTLTSVADNDLIGTESGAGIAAGARASGSTMNVVKRVAYKGAKRYCQINIKSTATAATPIAATAIQQPAHLPAA